MDITARLSEADVLEMLGRQIRLSMIERIINSDNSDGIKVELIKALVSE